MSTNLNNTGQNMTMSYMYNKIQMLHYDVCIMTHVFPDDGLPVLLVEAVVGQVRDGLAPRQPGHGEQDVHQTSPVLQLCIYSVGLLSLQL